MNSMASTDNSQVTDYAAHRAIGPAQPEIADLLGIALRGWFFLVAGTAAGIVGALMLLSTIQPTYKASSRIVFERTLPRYMQSNRVTNEPIIEDYDTMGQTYVIPSESILLKVVRSLSLASDPDFVGGKDSETLGSRVRGLFRNTAQALGFAKAPTEGRSVDPEKIAVDGLVRNLTVSREDVMSVITVSFSWKDPVKAAAIVNAIVDTYIDASISNKIKSTNLAGKVVQERVEELKQQVKDADRALQEFKATNNIVGSDQVTLSHGTLNILQHQLTSAHLAMADAKGRMDRIATDPNAIELLAPDNEEIKTLRGKLLDLSVRAAEIEKIVGKNHLAVVKLHDRMEDVRQAIASEQKRIVAAFNRDYELARLRHKELSAAVDQVISSEGAESNKVIGLRALEGSLESLRTLYNRMLLQVGYINRVAADHSIAPH